MTDKNITAPPHNLASLIRGLYGRVARRVKVDPSYVSRVARGERRSELIEATLEKELKRIMVLIGSNGNGANRNGSGRLAKSSAKKNGRGKRTAKSLQ
ncbi:MAG: hypothetical protein ABSA96_03900 [Candidatus Acidiferrales bacterium]